MTETTRVCEQCGAPLRDLVDGFCPFCRTRPIAVGGTFEAAPTAFCVVLLDAGRSKIEVIKQLRVLVARDFGTDLGLREAKDLVDRANPGAPPALIVDVDAARARDWAETFARAGAAVDVRPSGPAGPPPAAVPPGSSVAFGVYLLACGRKKINVIKEIRGITNLGLKEAKDLADGADHQPQLIVRGLDEHDARLAVARLAGVGATAEIRPA